MFDNFKMPLHEFSSHQFRATWQSKQMKDSIAHLPLEHVCCVHDYSANHSCASQEPGVSLRFCAGAQWGFFSRAFLVFLRKESKKRRLKQPGKLIAKSCLQPVNLPRARPFMNPLGAAAEPVLFSLKLLYMSPFYTDMP